MQVFSMSVTINFIFSYTLNQVPEVEFLKFWFIPSCSSKFILFYSFNAIFSLVLCHIEIFGTKYFYLVRKSHYYTI
jgi:hypothetical protein